MSRERLFWASRIIVGFALAYYLVLLVWVIGGRLMYPYELEWMCGSVLDHVERVGAGQPVYTAPTAGFIPFLYAPLYYWLSAFLGGTVLGCRLVSIAATLLQLVLARSIARGLGASRFWSWVAPGLIVACFGYVGFWYDLERADNLFGALAMLSVFLLLRAERFSSFIGSGILLGLAFLAKQQAAFYIVGAGVGVLAAQWSDVKVAWKYVAAFVATVTATLGGGLLYAMHREGPWFSYYVLKMPRAHGVMAVLIRDALLRDLLVGPLLVAGTMIFFVSAASAFWRRKVARRDVVLASVVIAGLVGAVLSRLHIGGHFNVLIPWTAFAAIATVVIASRSSRSVELVYLAGILIQLVIWSYDPGDYVPFRAARGMNQDFEARVRELEREGSVLIPARGHVTQPRSFQISALADVTRVEGHSPPDLIDNIVTQKYAAILDDARQPDHFPKPNWPPVLLEDVRDLHEPLLRNYFIAEQLDPKGVLDVLRAPAIPIWVYRRRRRPLSDEELLGSRERQLREMKLASEIFQAKLAGRKLDYTSDDIEAMAR